MSRLCPGYVQAMSRLCPGYVQAMSRGALFGLVTALRQRTSAPVQSGKSGKHGYVPSFWGTYQRSSTIRKIRRTRIRTVFLGYVFPCPVATSSTLLSGNRLVEPHSLSLSLRPFVFYFSRLLDFPLCFLPLSTFLYSSSLTSFRLIFLSLTTFFIRIAQDHKNSR